MTEAQERVLADLRRYKEIGIAYGRPEVKALLKAGLVEWVTKKKTRTVTLLRLTEKGKQS